MGKSAGTRRRTYVPGRVLTGSWSTPRKGRRGYKVSIGANALFANSTESNLFLVEQKCHCI